METKYLKKKGERTVPDGFGALPTAPRYRRHAKRCSQNSPAGKQNGCPTKYLVHRVIDSLVVGQCTLYCVQRDGYGPNDET